MIKYSILSKTIAHALRHEPWLYELEMDDEGWIDIETLLSSLRPLYLEWKGLNEKDLVEMVRQSDKQRYIIESGKIKASYGHSLPGKLKQIAAKPPGELFHGTSRKFISDIQQHGLLPMKRQYVHLAVDVESARQVGLRKDREPVILTILASKAHETGVEFFKGNEHIWLAYNIPIEFVKFSV